MYEVRINVGQEQHLILAKMSADTVVDTCDDSDIHLRLREGREEDLTVESTEAGPSVSARTKCEVRVPHSVEVRVRQVGANLTVSRVAKTSVDQVRGSVKLRDVGDAVFAEVYGNLRVTGAASVQVLGTVFGDSDLTGARTADLQNVRGNLRVKGADLIHVSRLGGNLQAKGMLGTVDCDQIGGNATLKDVSGLVTLERVAGNLAATNLRGGAKVLRLGGNLAFDGTLGTGCSYHFNTGGNAVLHLDEDASAYVTLTAQGNVQSLASLKDDQRTGNTLTGMLGAGGAEVVVEAGGNVLLGVCQSSSDGRLGDEIARQIEDGLSALDLEAIGRQASTEMESALSRLRIKMEAIDWDRIGFQTQKAVERAMDRMQVDIDRVGAKAARQQEHLRRKAEQEARRAERLQQGTWQMSQGHSSAETVDAEVARAGHGTETSPDLEEERLSILRMVEQGQVTPYEAEMLLDALE